MAADTQLRVVLCWHMHQPMYRDATSRDYLLPWTYLHALKDYIDMAAHLEAEPDARAVVNFAPVLLDQLDDYSRQVDDFLNLGMPIRDPLLASLAATSLPVEEGARRKLAEDCLKVNGSTVIKRFEPFQGLADPVRPTLQAPVGGCYLSDQCLFDLVTWYHLGWLAETVRRDDPRIAALQEQGRLFSAADRRGLLSILGKLLAGVIPRWRALANSGQVELAVSPYGHPILPLLQDLGSARDAMPDVPLPEYTAYPGGDQRARWHISEGISTFKHHFGFAPNGCWPSEGAVSAATLNLLGEFGFRWAATGETVLHNSLHDQSERCLHRGYRFGRPGITCYFRDDGLSDLIGFKYSEWHADDAVADLLHHLENIRQGCNPQNGSPVVSIILDGENAWEYYPENAVHFLSALYRGLAQQPGIRLTTFNDCVKEQIETTELPRVVAGSWVYGSFSTWIGDPDKNRAWDMLIELKQVFDSEARAGRISGTRLAEAERQLAICEGSDWFWWFGDYNPAGAVTDFDRLFRRNLLNTYFQLGVTPPDYLARQFAHGRGDPGRGGVMRHGKQQDEQSEQPAQDPSGQDH